MWPKARTLHSVITTHAQAGWTTQRYDPVAAAKLTRSPGSCCQTRKSARSFLQSGRRIRVFFYSDVYLQMAAWASSLRTKRFLPSCATTSCKKLHSLRVKKPSGVKLGKRTQERERAAHSEKKKKFQRNQEAGRETESA